MSIYVNKYFSGTGKGQSWSLWMPNFFNFNFDYKFVYFFYLCASVPNFINTFVYMHRKRKEQLKLAEDLKAKYD